MSGNKLQVIQNSLNRLLTGAGARNANQEYPRVDGQDIDHADGGVQHLVKGA